MLQHSWPFAIVLVFGLSLGCDNRNITPKSSNPATAPTTVPSTQPVSNAATTQPVAIAPAATQPAYSQLIIDGRAYTFPEARLRVMMSGNHVVARLYTNDPKAALEDDYKGNHFDLQLRLDDIQVPQQVYMASWQYQAPSREYNDSPYGIFLEGMRYQLQPLNASARFLGTMLQVRIDLEGQFLVFDDADKSGAPPKVAYVKGSLLAAVEYKD
ncbi:MAG TPA: hypothetical protein VGI81_14755 [Tepidisphaeraceae bacterium]|jgi:hypothetical protein